MIIYSLNDAAKFLNCSLKTIQRMVEKGEMPEPIREEKDKRGRIWRLWDSNELHREGGERDPLTRDKKLLRK
jgi:hypothetical protein